MNGIDTLLLNMLFILVFLLFVPLFLERYPKAISITRKRWIVTISAGIAVVCCMSFPITIFDGFIFDLRWIPVIVVGLYGGIPVSIFLTSLVLGYRLFLGGGGIYATIIISFFVLFFLIILTKNFVASSRKKKVMIGSCFSFATGILVLIVLKTGFHISLSPLLILVYLILTPSTTILVIYLSELIQETVYLNKKLIKAEKMEIVSHLASSISHEVRNPLAVVRGFLQMMEQMDLPESKRKEYLQISIGEIDRANDIIRNYLTFAKPSPENVEIIDIKQELEHAITIITPLANMNCVEVEMKIDHYHIKGEPQLLQQCLLNMTKNCLEAMPTGGILYIETKEQNHELVIQITDTGQGMTEEQLSRLGEPYYTTKGREGTGLGMMTAIQIIKLMNGRLDVRSKINLGTSFYIYLPIIDQPVEEEVAVGKDVVY